ncbi:MAG: flagellar hook-basal body protein [Phycisphaerales bacterium JB039]
MNYGLQISSSGLLTSLYRQDALTNNLANLNTVGFKPISPAVRQREPASIEDGLGHLPSSALLEQLGAGVLLGPNRVSFKPGPLLEGGELDLAIDGDGFFAVPGADGQSPRLTRDGRLTLDARGTLVQAASGLPVLNVAGRPIALPPQTPVEIDADGRIFDREGSQLDQIRLVGVRDTGALRPEGQGLFVAPPGALEAGWPAGGRIVQRFVEGSSVEPIDALQDITSASGAVSANAAMIDFQDRLMDRAINALGRVS